VFEYCLKHRHSCTFFINASHSGHRHSLFKLRIWWGPASSVRVIIFKTRDGSFVNGLFKVNSWLRTAAKGNAVVERADLSPRESRSTPPPPPTSHKRVQRMNASWRVGREMTSSDSRRATRLAKEITSLNDLVLHGTALTSYSASPGERPYTPREHLSEVQNYWTTFDLTSLEPPVSRGCPLNCYGGVQPHGTFLHVQNSNSLNQHLLSHLLDLCPEMACFVRICLDTGWYRLTAAPCKRFSCTSLPLVHSVTSLRAGFRLTAQCIVWIHHYLQLNETRKLMAQLMTKPVWKERRNRVVIRNLAAKWYTVLQSEFLLHVKIIGST
jgi:hypothetical protein